MHNAIIYMVNMFSACLSTRNGAKIYSQIVRSVILGCRTLSLTKLEKDLKMSVYAPRRL